MLELTGKVAFITGGSSGIGLGIAHALAARGVKLAIAARDAQRLRRARAELETSGTHIHAIQLDVTDRAAMAQAAEEVQRVFGQIHILCNNAGAGVMIPVTRATYRDWDWVIRMNIGGVINGIQAFLPKILAHGEGGHILSTASMSGLFVGGGAGLYSTTKYAVVGMMEALRAELEPHDIGVSVYCPGVVRSSLHESEERRPAEFAEPGRALSAELKQVVHDTVMSLGMDSREAGELVVNGICRNDLYILTHPEYEAGLRERFDAILASIPADLAAPETRVAAERKVGILSNAVYRKEIERRRTNGA